MLENVKNAESLCTLENRAMQKVSIIIYPFSLNRITELETKTSGIFGFSLVHPDLICVCVLPVLICALFQIPFPVSGLCVAQYVSKVLIL